MKSIARALLIFAFGFLVSGYSYSEQATKNNKGASFQNARLIAVAEFNKQTGDTYKVFKCTLAEENSKDWRFVFDEFENPPSPGSLIIIYVDKATGKPTVSWGR